MVTAWTPIPSYGLAAGLEKIPKEDRLVSQAGRVFPRTTPMRPHPTTLRTRFQALFLAAIAMAAAARCEAGIFSAVSESEKLTAVSSSAHNGYVRTRLPDGAFQRETYAFGNGGVLEGNYIDQFSTNDPTVDDVSFRGVAQMLAGPLSSQNYVPSPAPDATKLLIMVYWGRTIGGANTRDGNLRDQLNFANARLLGFDSEISIQSMMDASTVFFGRSFRSGMLDDVHANVLSAIEVSRYYAILRAYDFQSAWKEKKLKLLWETRFSLSERRHDFQRDLPAMAQDAELYFGQDSYGLVLKPIPEGHVRVGEATPVVERPEADDAGSFDPRSGVAGDWVRTSPGTRVVIHIDPSGESTFENPGMHVTVPATATTRAREVTVKVPGWGLIIRGTVKGNRISGSLLQYSVREPVTLTRIASPGQGEADGGKSPDSPGK